MQPPTIPEVGHKIQLFGGANERTTNELLTKGEANMAAELKEGLNVRKYCKHGPFDRTERRLSGKREKHEELKPCPFCGSRASIHRITIGRVGDEYHIFKPACISKTCVCKTTGLYFESIEAAVSAWNNRSLIPE
jgi:hypothetical protein